MRFENENAPAGMARDAAAFVAVGSETRITFMSLSNVKPRYNLLSEGGFEIGGERTLLLALKNLEFKGLILEAGVRDAVGVP